MRIVFTDQAEADFETIGDFIAEDNPLRAVTFVQELRGACRGLTSFPLRFPLVEGFREAGIRRRNHRRYAIFYRVEGPSGC